MSNEKTAGSNRNQENCIISGLQYCDDYNKILLFYSEPPQIVLNLSGKEMMDVMQWSDLSTKELLHGRASWVRCIHGVDDILFR